MHRNRAWHQVTMHIQRKPSRRDRYPERGTIGTVPQEPPLDYAAMARSMGVRAESPIGNPADPGPALVRAMAVEQRGKPALLDVLTQPS
ncbi:thiamine pyrophosphate-dependent enzyme [Burkholderia plantarii]|uniref:thiamine pyrophosphate-dependent enzyme n=1 Tax=Burkholderia plantarii TaxID=41899 RepID=UPI001F5B581C|nr:thiamine pyrophosphate-dependent enzyme [Burkholderia plantarii]